MKAFAPGKLVLTGAYAVLEGTPAIVLAVSRGATATFDAPATYVSDEVRAVLSGEAPRVDVTAMFEGKKKLGVGASAAGLVSALGADAARAGKDLADPDVRRAIFERARAGHALVQSGGSGVDVAASVYGGMLSYAIDPEGKSPARIAPLAYPDALVIEAFFAGESANTRSMRARVDALRARDVSAWDAAMQPVAFTSMQAHAAIARGHAALFVEATRAYGDALANLGRAADAPIVLPSFTELATLAEREGAAFVGAGAGGGDVCVFIGTRASSDGFRREASARGFTSFSCERDTLGLRTID